MTKTKTPARDAKITLRREHLKVLDHRDLAQVVGGDRSVSLRPSGISLCA